VDKHFTEHFDMYLDPSLT